MGTRGDWCRHGVPRSFVDDYGVSGLFKEHRSKREQRSSDLGPVKRHPSSDGRVDEEVSGVKPVNVKILKFNNVHYMSDISSVYLFGSICICQFVGFGGSCERNGVSTRDCAHTYMHSYHAYTRPVPTSTRRNVREGGDAEGNDGFRVQYPCP